jgi:hypothetical protein
MIKLIYSLAALLIGVQYIYSQDYFPYYKLINQAELATVDKQYSTADSVYRVAFDLVPRPMMADYYFATKNAMLWGNKDKAFEYLDKAVDKGFTLEQIQHEPTFKALLKDSRYKQLKQSYPEKRKQYLQKLNILLREEIQAMVKKDQKVRVFYKQGNTMIEADKENFEQLKGLIQKYGWTGFDLIGEDVPNKKFGGKNYLSYNISYILRHMKMEHLDELLPYLKEAVKKGTIYPAYIAMAYDYKGRYQLYGTMLKSPHLKIKEEGKGLITAKELYPHEDTSLFFPPIKSVEEVNQNRAKIGLEPLEDYCKKKGIKFPSQTTTTEN